MVINKKVSRKSAIKASNRAALRSSRRHVRAAEDVEEEEVEMEGEQVNVAPEASDLLFEADDVAELLAEVTGQDVAVTADEDNVVFEIGEDQYTVEAEGEEEILESTRKPLRNKKAVKASRKVTPRRAAVRRK